ncbi:MAG: glycosyltransferase [Balneolaceae bacterium]
MRKVEVISHSFPNAYSPYDATFVKDHIIAISEYFSVSASIPTPLALPFTEKSIRNQSRILLPDNVPGKRVFYISLPKKKFSRFIQASLSNNILSHLRETKPDLIHVQFLYPSGLAIPQIKKQFNCPVVLTIHGVDFYHPQKNNSLRNRLLNCMNAADKIIAVGPKLEADILKAYPQLGSKLEVIYNYVDTTNFAPSTEDEKENLRKQLKLASYTKHILTVANLRHKKGIDVLIQAVNNLKSTEAEFHIIGRLNDEPSYRVKIEEMIHKNQLTNVHLHGPKTREEILNWLKAVDGFVLPSRNEPFGIALIEALSCGLPSISTKSGGPEVVLSKNHGQLILPDDADALTEAIQNLLNNQPPDKHKLNEYISKNFGLKGYSTEYKNLFQSLL